MSVLEGPSRASALPHTSCSSTGHFWGSGATETPLVESPTAAEALSLSLLLAIQPEWTTENRDPAQLEQSQRVVAGRKRKMSTREDPRHQDHPPKHPRRTESLDPPQCVAPHVLTAPAGHSHSYPATSESPDVRMRHASTPGYDHSRSLGPRLSYHPNQYLQPHETDWAASSHRSERPVLPSISPSLDTGIPPITSSYAPAMYQRSSWYDTTPPQHHHGSLSHPPIMASMDPHQRQPQPHAQSESDSRPKPKCWEHGCNGREFSTFSNLLRHQRERAGVALKVACPRCGAEFTRKTARDGHLAHAKCKPIRPSPDPGKGSGSGGHRGSQSSHRSSHGHIY